MPENGNRSGLRIDWSSAAVLLTASVVCLTRLLLTRIAGPDGAACAASAIELYMLSYTVFVVCCGHAVTTTASSRIRRGLVHDALRLIQYSVYLLLAVSAVVTLIVILTARPAARLISADPNVSLVLICFAPSIPALALSSPIRVYFRCCGLNGIVRITDYVFAGLFFILTSAGALKADSYGGKVAALLHNSEMVPLYCACGALIGASCAALLGLVVLGVLFLILHGRVTESLLMNSAPGRGLRERASDLLRLDAYTMVPDAAAGLLALSPVLLDLMITVRTSENRAQAVAEIGAGWGGALSVLLLAACAAAFLFTGTARAAARDAAQDNMRGYRGRFGLFTYLHAFTAIPCALWAVSCADAIIPALAGRYATAISLLQLCGAGIYFLSLAILLLLLNADAGRTRRILTGALAASLGNLFVILVVRASGSGSFVGAGWAVLAYCVIFAAVLLFPDLRYFCGRSAGRLRAVLSLLSALIAAIPAYIFCHFLTPILGGIFCMILSAVLYGGIYIIVSVMLGAADMRLVDRLPMGGALRTAADLLQRRPE